jgi:hypothetical protein
MHKCAIGNVIAQQLLHNNAVMDLLLQVTLGWHVTCTSRTTIGQSAIDWRR